MKVGYSKTYPVSSNGTWEKIWLEDESIMMNPDLSTCTDEELEGVIKNVRKIQYALKKQVESFHYESVAAAEKQMGTRVSSPVDEIRENWQSSDIQKPVKSQEETIIEGIYSCQEIKVLESYSLIAKNNPKIQEAYDLKLQSLLQ